MKTATKKTAMKTATKKPTKPRRPPDRVLTNYRCIEETIAELINLHERMPRRVSEKALAHWRSAFNLLTRLNSGNRKWMGERGIKI